MSIYKPPDEYLPPAHICDGKGWISREDARPCLICRPRLKEQARIRHNREWDANNTDDAVNAAGVAKARQALQEARDAARASGRARRADRRPYVPPRASEGHTKPAAPVNCDACGTRLDEWLADAGERLHVNCHDQNTKEHA